MGLRVQYAVVLGLAALLGACTGPVQTSDKTPAGVIEAIAEAPKRAATAAERAAILNVVSSLPGAAAVDFKALQVHQANAPIVAFCGVAGGLGPRGELTKDALPGGLSGLAGQPPGEPANVSGMLKTLDGKVLAFDLRFGDFAAQRCRAMGFRFDN